ncbi:MAG TPA: hypothetical protein VMH01_10055 [Puia sp.]|nr:hypothetical protein [Puia sp.]
MKLFLYQNNYYGKIFLTVILLSFVFSCGPSTKIVNSWRDPNISVDYRSIVKVLVVGMVKDESTRRMVEDKMVSLMRANGVPSYTYLTQNIVKDLDSAKFVAKLRSDGFSGIMIMRLVNVEKTTSYVYGSVQPSYYGYSFGYYSYASPMYYSPGYYQTDKYYTVETTVYSTMPDKLVWTATTSTVNPEKFDQTIEEIAKILFDQMKKDGFLKE